jgi:hypothetical protein
VGIALDDLVTRLQADVPARGGVPSTAQYEYAVKDAVADYARRRPMTLITTLSVVSGTATYALPADFLFIIKLDDFTALDGIIHTATGIVPLSSDWNERYTVNGRTMTFTPTPSYTLDRTLRYAAGHVLDDDDAYPYLTDEDAGILLLKAQASALRKQALAAVTATTGEITEYAIGDERVKKSSPSESLRAQAAALESEYLEQVSRAVGAQGSRARYDSLGQLI